jgi:exonuclease III
MHQQSGLNVAKQLQTQDFIQRNSIDILHCQEINIDEDSFKNCDNLNASYNIHANNAINKYGTASIVRNNLSVQNIRTDTEGRGIAFDIGNITLENFYLHSGTDDISRWKR